MAKKKNKDANKNAKRTKIICLINDEAYRDNSYEENITDRNLYNILKDNENITTLTPVLYDFAQVKFSTGEIQDCMCWGISNTAEYIVNLDRIHGRMITEKDVKNRNMICLIDEAMADRIYGRLKKAPVPWEALSFLFWFYL